MIEYAIINAKKFHLNDVCSIWNNSTADNQVKSARKYFKGQFVDL